MRFWVVVGMSVLCACSHGERPTEKRAAPPSKAAAKKQTPPKKAPPKPQPQKPVKTDADLARVARLQRLVDVLRPLHHELTDRDRQNGWLSHRDEPGQTFAAWLARGPELATPARRTIYIQPLGALTATDQTLIKKVTEFLTIYFGLPVKTLSPQGLDAVPPGARRKHPAWGDDQIDTTWILYKKLAPRLPDDAAALVGLTAHDLWPGDNWKGGGWNYLHGMASHRERVGVWSWYRLNRAGPRRTLLRTLKTASHELGHTFSMLHCTAYRCNMQGRIGVDESDRTPLALGPDCLAKLLFATGVDPVNRFDALAAFAKREGLKSEAAFYRKSAAALRGASPQ